ncbi:response regulator [Phenylobacterium sp.]|uniref:response regulator n=1 Tax=Phenylobacterium sp. TaxID=1871053 RepID=UPI0011F6C511|nr:response regulator [Phenylobacterium sp.]THD64791.1 MAG: response regulator [Phenylobacterium sp.]
MSLQAFFFDRVTAEITQQMEGVAALTDQLSRQRLTPDAQACVSGAAEAADSARRLLARAIDLRKVTMEGVTLDPAPLNLRELIDAVQERWAPQASMSGVTLLVSYDGDPEACALADRTRLLQVFDGFVGEAVASLRRGAVEASVRAVAGPEGIRFEGRVRGARDAAWDAQELETRVKDVEARFGLEVAIGVVLARQIVDGLGGTLRSEGVGGGSETLVFEILLPAAETPAEAPQAAERSAHVLVVDDNATNRMVAQALCEMFDCTCESANDGAEAVEAARGGRFDLILMDIKMPVMDGVAATRAIRALTGPASLVPIIALTANAEPEDAEGYLAAGMNGVVEKPMKPEHLLAALQAALGEGVEDETPGSTAAAA